MSVVAPGAVPARDPLLLVRKLNVHYTIPPALPWHRPITIRAVEGIHFDLDAGQTLGVVGESGCGKSTLARALVGLQPITSGAVLLGGRDVAKLDDAGRRALRRDMQLVFQDPLASLNPRMTVGEILAEPLRNLCPELNTDARWERITGMLKRVGLDPVHHLRRYPHEFSGGQCQRIGIARALVLQPKVLICDEAVSALDVSIRAQIIELLMGLQRELGLAIVFIAHDLAVVSQISDRVMVMYLGRVMEHAPADELFNQPRHPYTRALISAVPIPDPDRERQRQRIIVSGDVPSAADPPSGCVFRTRCHYVQDLCAREVPALRRLRGGSTGSACHYAEEIGQGLPAP